MHMLLKDSPDEQMLLDGERSHRQGSAGGRGGLHGGLSRHTLVGDRAAVLSNLARSDLYFEYSANEKVALEVAAGAAMCGLRAMATMKHVGVNVASDALMTLAYTG
jgi:indolepyruvate ferredoxin oxidoreductase, alpha subunit